MLAGAGAVHGERALDQPLDEAPWRARPRRHRPCRPAACRWKLPSPTWPTIGATRRLAAMSRWVSVTHSASREIGTQTSVATALAPGRSARAGPIGVVARLPEPGAILGPRRPVERAAAELLRRSRRSARDCSATPASVPWNSTNSIGVSRQRRASNRRCTRCTCSSSSSSMRATGMPDWMVGMAALQQASTDGKRADAADDRLGNAGELAASAR